MVLTAQGQQPVCRDKDTTALADHARRMPGLSHTPCQLARTHVTERHGLLGTQRKGTNLAGKESQQFRKQARDLK